MVRSFPADFAAQTSARQSRPYLVLQIDWLDGYDVNGDEVTETEYFLDRPSDSFAASGTRVPASGLSDALVVEWGQVHLTLKEMQAGGVDALTLKLQDLSGSLRARLAAYVQQHQRVTIWRMWDEDAVTWPTDAAKIFVGTIQPASWTEEDGTVTLPVEDFAKRLLVTVECRARSEHFGLVPREYEDRNIPLCWGAAHRVEAVLIERPWETRTLEPIARTAALPITVKVEDHPSELGMTDETLPYYAIGVEYERSCWLGNDGVVGYFTASGSPDAEPSTFTITSWSDNTTASATLVAAFDFGVDRYGIIWGGSVFPQSLSATLDSVMEVGTLVDVRLNGAWSGDEITEFVKDDPAPGYYKIKLDSANADMVPGMAIRVVPGAGVRNAWPAGAILRPKEGRWIYACNALPSYRVHRVEGYGSLLDASGDAREGFVILGGRVADTLSGTVEVADSIEDPYTVNLNDDRWEEANTDNYCEVGLERRLTTIEFEDAPRSIEPSLKDNRIWVTLDGVETSGTGGETVGSTLITNPAAVLSEYLQHEQLMALDAAYINEASFTAAATTLNQRKVGFAQVESMDGLTLLQDIARQCRSVIFTDQGEVYMKVLRNNTSGSALTLTQDDVLERTLAFEEAPIDDLVSRVTCKWRRSWDDITGKDPYTVLALNADVEAQFGLVNREIDVWLYRRRAMVEAEAHFWRDRWSTFWRHVRLSTFHKALKLQPGDWIQLTYLLDQVAYFADGKQTATTAPQPPGGSASDLAVDSLNNKRVTSASYTFRQIDVGRSVVITSGSPWTAGSYLIDSVSGGAAVLATSPAATGTTGGAFSLSAKACYGVYSDSGRYDFAGSDAGRLLHVASGPSWTVGVYTIEGYRVLSIGGDDKHCALFTSSLGTTGELASGVIDVGGSYLFESTDCEVLEVKDTGPRGIVELVVRHAQDYGTP